MKESIKFAIIQKNHIDVSQFVSIETKSSNIVAWKNKSNCNKYLVLN